MKQPQTLNRFPELLTCICLCWLICSPFTTQVGLTQCCQPSRSKDFQRLGERPLTKRHSSLSTGLAHNLGGTEGGPSLTQIMSMCDEQRHGPPHILTDFCEWARNHTCCGAHQGDETHAALLTGLVRLSASAAPPSRDLRSDSSWCLNTEQILLAPGHAWAKTQWNPNPMHTHAQPPRA